ncbi:PEP-CTERM sorting domain-containing protein [Janthinobacterium sp. GB4P2]|uniref:PEP-CTERM sorting domain-containing protein n=1 Tax=Janthinobacterium sp. GB4P2 TaxID=3424189 RepID=UPI003F20C6DE
MQFFRKSLLSLLVGMAATSASAAPASAPQFTLTRFNYTLPAHVYAGDINSQGEIFGIGISQNKDVWYSTSGTTLNVAAPLPGNITISSLNASGQGIAYSTTGSGKRSYYYVENGAFTPLAVNGQQARATAINDAGQVTLTTFDSSGNARGYVYSSAGGYQEIGAAGGIGNAASNINSAGAVVGYTNGADGKAGAYLYANGVMTPLVSEFDAPSYANGINNAGQVSGWATGGQGMNGTEAFFWANGQYQRIAKLSTSIGIDGLGRVLGYNDFGTLAMLWDGNETYDLSDLVGETGWYFGQVGGINEAGQISAYGCRGSICEVVRLDPLSPVPEPSTYALLLAGMALLTCAARKRS